MATYYQQAQLSSPERAYLPTSAGLIPYNPGTANAGSVGGYGSAANGVQYTPSGYAGMVNAGQAQQPLSQYHFSSGPSHNPGLGYSTQAQYSVPHAVTGMQPNAVAPMVAPSGMGLGTAAVMPGGAAAGTAGAIEAAEEEAEAETRVGSCLGCCGPPAAPGGTAEVAAGGPVGPDAAAAPGPPGPAGPAGERIVQYFKSGYNSAAAGANINNGLPAAIAATPARRSVPTV